MYYIIVAMTDRLQKEIIDVWAAGEVEVLIQRLVIVTGPTNFLNCVHMKNTLKWVILSLQNTNRKDSDSLTWPPI